MAEDKLWKRDVFIKNYSRKKHFFCKGFETEK